MKPVRSIKNTSFKCQIKRFIALYDRSLINFPPLSLLQRWSNNGSDRGALAPYGHALLIDALLAVRIARCAIRKADTQTLAYYFELEYLPTDATKPFATKIP